MVVGSRITVFTLVTLTLAGTFVRAQGVSKKEVDMTIAKMANLIRDKYVFPERGKKIADQLILENKKGRFYNAQSWKVFDSLTTVSIRAFSQDGHMYVAYDPKTVKELSQVSEEPEPGNFSEDPFFYGKNAVLSNYGFKEVSVLEGNIGYIKLSEINISEKSLPVLYAAMTFIYNTNALIIDVRDNGGGGNAVGNVFESFFLPKETPLLEFRQRDGTPKLSKTVAWLTEKKYDKPLYILINNRTYSAAEAFSFSLQATKRAIIVGQNSGGGAHMNSWYPLNDHTYISISTGAPTLPGTEISWEGKGVQPDHKVEPGKEIEFITALLKSTAK